MLQNLQAYEFYFSDIWIIYSYSWTIKPINNLGKTLGKYIAP